MQGKLLRDTDITVIDGSMRAEATLPEGYHAADIDLAAINVLKRWMLRIPPSIDPTCVHS